MSIVSNEDFGVMLTFSATALLNYRYCLVWEDGDTAAGGTAVGGTPSTSATADEEEQEGADEDNDDDDDDDRGGAWEEVDLPDRDEDIDPEVCV